MPLDDDTVKRIRRIHAAYDAKVKQVQADRTLSEHGKARHIAMLHHEHQTQINKLAEASNQTYQQLITQIERKLFGIHDIPNDVSATLSYRDAVDRVADVKTAAEAQLMLRRAHRSGDGILARALFERAWDASGEALAGSGWGELVNDYVRGFRPELADDVAELANLQQANNRQNRMAEQIETSLYQPPELAKMAPGDRREAISDASVAGLEPGGGTSSDPTVNEAWAKFAAESRDGAYGA